MLQDPKKIRNIVREYHNKKSLDIYTDERAAFSHYVADPELYSCKRHKTSATLYLKKILEYTFPDEKITNIVSENALQYLLFDFTKSVPFPSPNNPKFTFIDLFAGIGGFRIAFQNLRGECIYSSEWDKYSKKTYEANFGEVPFGDITKQEVKAFIPKKFDILCAGFPCQAFSIAGKRGGFEDTRGTLFFDVAEIIKKHKPKAIFLENVKGLTHHDRGKTLATILNVLREDLNYYVPEPKIINAKNFGVPQNRERIFIVAFRKDLGINSFEYPKPLGKKVVINDIIEENEVSVKYYLSTQYLQTLENHKKRHADKGNGFGFEIIDKNKIANAVVCGGMGRERNLIYDHRLTNFRPVTHIKGEVNRKGIRKMTPREWARLQGYPDSYKIVVSDGQAYKQFGNSVAVPAIEATARKIIESLEKNND
ncbi:MAG: DNA cytosine methyltransferase [Candidatus Neomarinimicrobiota bacterium]